MASRRWDGRTIENISPELLNTLARSIPFTTLKRVASMLQSSSPSAGGWEMVAERLGFSDNSRLDEIRRTAHLRQEFPGLLVLEEWGRSEASTVYVLLHVLRECGRDDIVLELVTALSELHMMYLSVSIQDVQRSEQRFLRIRTKKKATLYESLANVLEPAVYYYDIVLPRNNVTWETTAGELQGAQLTLKRRQFPNQESYSLIYGTLADPPPFPTLGSVPDSPPLPTNVTTTPLGFNIPPSRNVSPSISFTYAKEPAVNTPEVDFRAIGPVRLSNDLSRPRQSSAKNGRASNSPPHLSSPLLFPPPPCGPGRSLVTGEAAAFSSHLAEHMDIFPLLTTLNGHDSFTQSTHPRESTWPKMPSESQHDESNLSPESRCFHGPSSHTTAKNKDVDGVDKVVSSRSAQDFNKLALEPEEHDESMPSGDYASMETDGSNSSSTPISISSDYIPHNHPMIRFCNNPSPNTPSSSSTSSGFSSATCTTSTSTASSRLPVTVFRCDSHESQQAQDSDFSDSAGADRKSDSPPARLTNPDYMPHSFIVRQSQQRQQQFQKSASVPVFQDLLSSYDMSLMSSSVGVTSQDVEDKEKNVYVNQDVEDKEKNVYVIQDMARVKPAEPMDDHSLRMENPASKIPSPPLRCTYSSTFPGSGGSLDLNGTSQHFYLALGDHSRIPPCTFSQRHTQEAGGSTTTDDGYMDMSGSIYPLLRESSPSVSAATSEALTSFPMSISLDSYMAETSADTSTWAGMSLDSIVRPASASEAHLQPRSRRPFMESYAHFLEDPAQYSYIDHKSLPSDPSGEGEGPASGRPRTGTDRGSRTGEDDGSGRRSSGSSGEPPALSRPRRGPHSNSPPTELSEAELQQVPGWCPTVTERTIDSAMSRHVNEDGNFIVWRFSTGGKYVISVSHLGNVRHYAIYETERDGVSYFYAFPRGFRSRSLAELVAHYQSNHLSQPTKTFKTPEGESKEGRRNISNRFSHVRLRKPLTVRYGHDHSRSSRH